MLPVKETNVAILRSCLAEGLWIRALWPSAHACAVQAHNVYRSAAHLVLLTVNSNQYGLGLPPAL